MSEIQSFSNLIVWGDPLKISDNFELAHYQDFNKILPLIANNKIKVLVLNNLLIQESHIDLLFSEIQNQSQKSEVIAILDRSHNTLTNTLVSTLNPSSIHYRDEFTDAELENSLIDAIHRYDYHQQNNNFYLLFQEQSEKLNEISQELEERIKVKNKSLKRSQARLLYIKDQLNLMYECILGVQNAKTIAEIEDFLTDKLSEVFEINWIRALVGTKEVYGETLIIEGQKQFKIFGTPLYFGNRSIGHIYFAKLNSEFLKKDESFFLQLSEIVSIKINQIIYYSDLTITQSQWQQTFKAIKHQVIIIDDEFKLLNSNLNNSAIGKPCYEVLFNNKSPCHGCQIGKKFELQNQSDWFKVTSQKMKLKEEKSDVFINIYQNITEQKNIEMKILETAKLSDLGILAGSLAHELNNPLAGIITFLQLMVSDPENTPQESMTDIQDLLNSALDCKQVIQSILENVRNNKSLDMELKSV